MRFWRNAHRIGSNSAAWGESSKLNGIENPDFDGGGIGSVCHKYRAAIIFLLVRSLHILAAFWYVGGLAGYIDVRLTMISTSNLDAMMDLIRLRNTFEKYRLIPGGAALVIFGLLTAWYEQWPRFALEAIQLLLVSVPFVVMSGPRAKMVDKAFAEALQTCSITPNLRAAVHDKVLCICEFATVLIVLLILLLMLIKPA